MTTLTATFVENWDRASFQLETYFPEFEVEDCDFDGETGIHFFFNEANECIAVLPDGTTYEWVEE